jgi:hypothetical protein
MSTFLSNTDRFNSLITDVPVLESPAEAADHRGWMAEYRAHMIRKQAQATEDPEQRIEYAMAIAHYQVEAALQYSYANRRRAWMAEDRAQTAKDPIQAAEERAQAAEYRAQSTNWLLQSIKKRVCTVQDDGAKKREAVASFCSFQITRYRNLVAEERARAAKNPDQAAKEYAQMAEEYAKAMEGWPRPSEEDLLKFFKGEYADVLGDYLAESLVYRADAAEYRARMITFANQNRAAEYRTDAFDARASAASLKAQEIEMLLRATQNPARAIEYQVWWIEYLTYAAKYSATSTPAQAANCEALRDMLRLMEILQGFQELITAKKASIVIVGQLDSFQIIHPLLAFLQSDVRKALREAWEEQEAFRKDWEELGL